MRMRERIPSALLARLVAESGLSVHTVRRRLTGLAVHRASARLLDPVLEAHGLQPGSYALAEPLPVQGGQP